MPHPAIILSIAVLVLSALAFAVYGWDKWCAARGRSRVSERALVLWALVGGWPGAYLAMRTFRHKTSKPSFRRRALAASIVNVLMVIAAVVLAYRAGIL